MTDVRGGETFDKLFETGGIGTKGRRWYTGEGKNLAVTIILHPKGTIQVIQEGREGTQEITTKKVYENGEVVSEEQVGAKVTKAAVNKIVEIGTGSKKTSYKVQAGDKVYITSDRAEIMVEPNVDSTKVATLAKGTALTILSVQGDWYQVNGQSSTGYIKIENTTYINQNESYEEENNSNNSDNSSITPLSFDMSLNKPSGLTLDQFKKVLSDSKDKNKIFEKIRFKRIITVAQYDLILKMLAVVPHFLFNIGQLCVKFILLCFDGGTQRTITCHF